MPEYFAWKAMIARCTNVEHPDYPKYGGRGIGVCVRWIVSFENFLADVGRRPAPHLSLDRIENNDDYLPGNVRWADKPTQNRNTRATSMTSVGAVIVRELARRRQKAQDIAYAFGISIGNARNIINGHRWAGAIAYIAEAAS